MHDKTTPDGFTRGQPGEAITSRPEANPDAPEAWRPAAVDIQGYAPAIEQSNIQTNEKPAE